MMDVNEMFNKKNIYIEGEMFSYKNEVSEEDCIEQIRNIIEFQNRLMGYRENIIPRLSSVIGKDIENYKVALKKLKRVINNLKDNRDSISEYIIKYDQDLVLRSEYAINTASGEGYYEIIKRSMIRYEVCLGRCDRGNIKSDGNKLNIGITKNIAYNLVEHDMYSYLKRLRKKRIDVDYIKLIKLFINESNLDNKSLKYIIGLLSFPSEEIKLIQRYSSGKLNIGEAELLDILNNERIMNKGIIEICRGELNE